MWFRSRFVYFVIIGVSYVLIPTPSRAQDPAAVDAVPAAGPQPGSPVDQAAEARASEHFDKGVALYRRGDFQGAFVEFRRAYDAVPDPGLLFNLGQTAAKLNDYAQAEVLFERYVQRSGDALPPERRALVDAELKQLRDRIGHAEISVSVSGAEIRVDQRSVGRAPLAEPLALNVGRHEVEVRAEGYRTEVQPLELAGGEERKLEFRLQQVSAPVATATVSAPPEPASEPAAPTRAWLRPARIASLTILGVAAAGAVATGVLASSAHDDFEAELAARPGDLSDIEDARTRTRRYNVANVALIGVAAASAALTVTFLLMERSDRRAVSLAVNPTGVAVRGGF